MQDPIAGPMTVYGSTEIWTTRLFSLIVRDRFMKDSQSHVRACWSSLAIKHEAAYS